MNSLEEEMELMRDNPLYKEPFEAHDYDFFLPDLEALNASVIGMQKKYEALEGEHSKNVVAILRHLIRDVKTSSRDKILQKVSCVLLKEKYEQLKAAEEAARKSDLELQLKKDTLSNREQELSQRIKNVSVGSDVQKAFDELLKKFQQVSVSNKEATEEVMKSNPESLNAFMKTLKTSINDVAESSMNSQLSNSSKKSIDETFKQAKKSIDDSKISIEEGVKNLDESIRSATSVIDEGVKSVTKTITDASITLDSSVDKVKISLEEKTKASIDEFVTSAKATIDDNVKSSNDKFLTSMKEAIGNAIKTGRASAESRRYTSYEKGSIQVQLDAQKTNLARVTGERDTLELEKSTLQAEKALLDTRVSTLQNRVLTLSNEKSKIAALEKTVINRDEMIKALENTIIPRDNLTQQLLDQSQTIQQLQSIDYEKVLEDQKAIDEAHQKENNNHLDQIRESHIKQLADMENKHARHLEHILNYQNEFVTNLLKVAKVPVAPCPSCAQHEGQIASLKRDRLAKDSEVKILRDQVGTIKGAITSQTELVKLRSTLYEDIMSFKSKKEAREQALASMTKDRDQWRDMHHSCQVRKLKSSKSLV
ncbi:uncharacterized protein EAF01_006928 [Botrytis porri]|uniref:uncharacterized protein n=1 Tax=Botrytis porri TaxID=87229 RepID=UPI001900C431|nr:uncharacterized protein EAF01_006928 [Botrytis porri]KAF7901629.1 hypothetical protein EAF01_006928 [Botrytis porri]